MTNCFPSHPSKWEKMKGKNMRTNEKGTVTIIEIVYAHAFVCLFWEESSILQSTTPSKKWYHSQTQPNPSRSSQAKPSQAKHSPFNSRLPKT